MDNKELKRIVQKCAYRIENEVEAGLLKKDAVTKVFFNPRLKRVLGRCCKQPNGKFHLEFNQLYYMSEHVTLEAKLKTIYHELLHTVDGCQNHGAKWKRLGLKVEAVVGIEGISETKSKVDPNYTKESAKYTITCSDCDKVLYRRRSMGGNKYEGVLTMYRCKCKGSLTQSLIK